MSAFDQSITLKKMKDETFARFDKTDERLSGLESMIERRLGGKTRVGMFFGMLVTVGWGVGLFYLLRFLARRPELTIPRLELPKVLDMEIFELLLLVAMGLTALLLVLMVLHNLIRMRYYGAILNAKAQVARLRGRVAVGKTALNSNLTAYEKCGEQGWKQPLPAGESIIADADRVDKQISGMDSLSDGFIAKLKSFLYHVVCILWCVVGCMAEYELLYELANAYLFDGDLTWKIASIVLLVFTVITLIIEIIVARAIWSGTDCDVNNVTVLGILPGPLMFALLIALTAVVVVLVVLALQLVLGLAALFFGGAIVFGMTSGG